MRRFSLHSVPTKVSLAWLEKVGREPDPDILLKFKPPSTDSSSNASSRSLFRPLDRKDVLYESSIFDLDHFESKRGGLACPTESVLLETPSQEEAEPSILDRGKMSLLKSPTFWLHCWANALYTFAFCVPTTFLISFALSLDIPVASAKYLISIIGVVNCVGRFSIGFISDLLHIRGVYLAALGMMLSGVATLIVIFAHDHFLTLALYSGIFATGSAAYMTLPSIVVVELFGLERLTDCYGYLQLFRGVGAILGPPCGGFIAERRGNFTWAFALAGVLMISTGATQGLLPLVAKWEGERKRVKAMAKVEKPSRSLALEKLNQMLMQPKEQLI